MSPGGTMAMHVSMCRSVVEGIRPNGSVRERRHFSRMAQVFAGAVLAATAVGGWQGTAVGGLREAAKPRSGGTLIIGVTGEVASLDPLRATGATVTALGGDRMSMVFDTLLHFNSKTGQAIPGLAESLTTQDAVTWTLKLRPDVKFTDGTPLDAEAVIFNYRRYQDPANTFGSIGSVTQITKMAATNPTTVVFTLGQANGSFPIVLAEAAGMMASPTAIRAGVAAFGQKPIGAGAFILKEWVRDSHTTFVRNPNYFDPKLPYLDTVTFRILPDLTTRDALLKSGDIDMISPGSVGPATINIARDDPKRYSGYEPAQTPGAVGLICNLQKPPCDDIRFREAIALSLDFKVAKQVFNKNDYPGEKLTCMPFGTESPYCAKDVFTKYNLKRAQKLVGELKADGITPEVTLTYVTNSAFAPGDGEWLQQQFTKAGIKTNLRPMMTAQYSPAIVQHDFQLATYFETLALDMTARYYNNLHSVGGPNGGRDIANLNNAQLDVALEKSRNSLSLAGRIAGTREAQRIVADQFLATWYVPQLAGLVAKKTVQLPDFQTPNNFIRYESVWLKNA